VTGPQLDPNKPITRPPEPWRQRLIRSLLYGRNVDRAAKARARVGLAMIAFGGVYGIIAVRLIMFAVNGDTHAERRSTRDAIATARPDIVDRNGAILATDVKSPSLFSEPRRIIDKDEAVELLTGALPDLDGAEVRERIMSKKGFVWVKREITPQQQARFIGSAFPASASCREQARLSERHGGRPCDRLRQYRQCRHRRHREIHRQRRACRICIARASRPRPPT
jgi:cell division protein FtsI (penicillin-binding protein 3)